MSYTKLEVTVKGIKNRLKSVKPYKAISEYIWNGFDAGASIVEISYKINELGTVTDLSVKDNGSGIAFDKLSSKFKPVFYSEKRDNHVGVNLIHGKNGLGRLTFFHFAKHVSWTTVYKDSGEFYTYTVNIDADSIDKFSSTNVVEKNSAADTGTCVEFKELYGLSESYLKYDFCEFVRREFALFLHLNKSKGYSIFFDGVDLSYECLVKDVELSSCEIEGYKFDLEFVRWVCKLNGFGSNYYCLSSREELKTLSATKFNNKGDGFYHSVFIRSDYFDDFDSSGKLEKVPDLFGSKGLDCNFFRELIDDVNIFISAKRKPFISEHAKKIVDDLERSGCIPEFNSKNKWEMIRHESLKEVIEELYQVEPRVFSNLNSVQKKTLVGFISLVVDSGDVGDLFKILEGVLELSSQERELFARQLKTTKMSSIVSTIEMISDRYKSVAEFERLVFDPTMYAGEVPHLQRMMERNYWLIGEEYCLLTAAEPKFEEALRRYTHHLHGIDEKVKIQHEDKNREMDLFLVRQRKHNKKIENIVLELKHPVNIRLGKKELDQVYSYYQVIKSEPQFNASNMEWKFYLIGNEFDSSGYIESQFNSLKFHGESGLAFSGEYKIYVFKWSEIFSDFKIRHDFLDKNLKLELERLSDGEYDSADDIINRKRTSDAPAQYSIVTNSN